MDFYSKYKTEIDFAFEAFWTTRADQIAAQKLRGTTDAGTRGAVTAGNHLNGLRSVLAQIATDLGVPAEHIHLDGNQLPGYFRPTKDWDLTITSPKGHLLVCLEFKSQVGSFGNNFNNRTEEALGSATDLWKAYREGAFPGQQQPWLGYLVIVEKSEKSTSSIRISEPRFKVFPEFQGSSYLKRYELLCQRMVLERLYTSASLVWTSHENGKITYDSKDNETSFRAFLDSYGGYLVGKLSEFSHR